MGRARVVAISLFYFSIVFFSVVLLAAAQLRLSAGAAFDIWRLNYEANRHINESLLKDVKAALEKLRDDSSGEANNSNCVLLYDDGVLKLKALDDAAKMEVVEARKKHTKLEDLYGNVWCAVKGYLYSKSDATYYTNAAASDKTQISELKESLASNNRQMEDLIKGHQDFVAFEEMRKTWYQTPFVVLPYDLIVLLLVMLMGALGGVIRLLRDFGMKDRENPAEAEYVFIPLIGSVVAVGGYVLAKTGLLLLSSAGNESSLSPFMVSLVGIVSGLLAREVIDTLATRGRELLKKKDNPGDPLEAAEAPKQP